MPEMWGEDSGGDVPELLGGGEGPGVGAVRAEGDEEDGEIGGGLRGEETSVPGGGVRVEGEDGGGFGPDPGVTARLSEVGRPIGQV